MIDYYFENGQQRVLDLAREFIRAAGLERAAEAGQLVTTESALDGMVALSRTLNGVDPHDCRRVRASPVPDWGGPVTRHRTRRWSIVGSRGDARLDRWLDVGTAFAGTG